MYLRIWIKEKKKNKLNKFLQNIITEDISNLNDGKMKEINKLLKKKKVKNILSYASSLDILTKFLEDNFNEEKYDLNSIISSSEILQDVVRKRVKKVFKCNIVSRYSNEENGILAQDCIDDNYEMHLNVANYYFEFLKLEKDEPAKEGELARIVVTDLWNYALPMIRYDTGDLAIVGDANCKVGDDKVIKKIFGRKVDLIYDVKGNPISPFVINNNMSVMKGIKQYKFVQVEKNKYKIILNLNKKDFEENKLKKTFEKILGNAAQVDIEYTDEIPVLSSGKRKQIENLYIKGVKL